MDDDRFDRWLRGLDGQVSRRALSGLVAGLVLALGLDTETDAKRKHKKKHKKKKKTTPEPQCAAVDATCTADSACCSETCCLEPGASSGGPMTCEEAGRTCCTAEEGGGSCPSDLLVCCDESVPGECAPSDFPVCCPANNIQSEPYSCLANAVCCNTGSGCCLASPQSAGKAARTQRGRLVKRRTG